MTAPSSRSPRQRAIGAAALALVALLGWFTVGIGARMASAHLRATMAGDVVADTTSDASGGSRVRTSLDGLGWADGLALGVVEGITEYLPVSSTGHLIVSERFLDLDPPKGEARDALDSYTVVIQIGAIFAVLLLYRRRVGQILGGVTSHNPTGRKLLLAIIVGFVPVGIAAKLLENVISDHLLEPAPVAVAWLVGGIALLVGSRWLSEKGRHGIALEDIMMRQAYIIGAVQVFALWPGVSRSLVTIVGGVAAGLTIGAAVEFSFLLGLATLSAATLYELVTNGNEIIDRFGIGAPFVGVVAAFVAAAASVKLFVEYLNRKDLRIFGVYRVAIAILTFVLLGTNVI